MLVKCRCCGNRIDKTNAYVIQKGKSNFYYCNEGEYLTIQSQKEKENQKKKELQEQKNKIYGICCEIFGYKIISSNFWKEYNSLPISQDILLLYLTDTKDKLSKALSKSFDSEYGKIRYFFAIIRNSHADWLQKRKQEELDDTLMMKHNVEFYEQTYIPKERKKPLSFYEE